MVGAISTFFTPAFSINYGLYFVINVFYIILNYLMFSSSERTAKSLCSAHSLPLALK